MPTVSALHWAQLIAPFTFIDTAVISMKMRTYQYQFYREDGSGSNQPTVGLVQPTQPSAPCPCVLIHPAQPVQSSLYALASTPRVTSGSALLWDAPLVDCELAGIREHQRMTERGRRGAPPNLSKLLNTHITRVGASSHRRPHVTWSTCGQTSAPGNGQGKGRSGSPKGAGLSNERECDGIRVHFLDPCFVSAFGRCELDDSRCRVVAKCKSESSNFLDCDVKTAEGVRIAKGQAGTGGQQEGETTPSLALHYYPIIAAVSQHTMVLQLPLTAPPPLLSPTSTPSPTTPSFSPPSSSTSSPRPPRR
ncbi:hypothetical protein GALMADRAFT_145274 [Galerina marginata CBS 339.88]|uniref:Uncharacterized protein n=1 Tax=Galerina marginata (strain CBS 339.88) TaxID=685588 RepID=A0A067SG32_GALM3|nr:hypothetical protein GALMADRAFT_145274 [Galerina marginata CBS 339.88]